MVNVVQKSLIAGVRCHNAEKKTSDALAICLSAGQKSFNASRRHQNAKKGSSDAIAKCFDLTGETESGQEMCLANRCWSDEWRSRGGIGP
jgi:hypothetical protein